MKFGLRAAAMAAVAAMVGAAACGGGGSPTSPSGGSSSGGSAGPVGATITIGANGTISPAQVTIGVGQSVMFVNSHSAAHDMTSDPHPIHTDCPAMNAVGNLGSGQSRATNAFTTARTCGFHDHNNPDSTGLQGRIVIQ